jgi:hypothetical protein
VQPILLQASTEKANKSSFNNTTTEEAANIPVAALHASNEFRSSTDVVHDFNAENQEATDFAMLINNLNAADHEPMQVRAPEDFFQNESPIVSERKTHNNEAS